MSSHFYRPAPSDHDNLTPSRPFLHVFAGTHLTVAICPLGEVNGTPLQYSCWRIPWMEEPGGLQSMGSLGVRHDWATSFSLFTFMHGKGNGNPLQCSCLENPRDGGAWWATVYGAAQSQTQLKWLGSSSSRIFTELRISFKHHGNMFSRSLIYMKNSFYRVHLFCAKVQLKRASF